MRLITRRMKWEDYIKCILQNTSLREYVLLKWDNLIEYEALFWPLRGRHFL